MLNVNFSESHTVDMSTTANWRVEYDDFLADFINSVDNDTTMSEPEDITGAVFRNKSKLLGQKGFPSLRLLFSDRLS